MLVEQKAKEAEGHAHHGENSELSVTRGESRRDNVMTFREEASAGRNPLVGTSALTPMSEEGPGANNVTSPTRDITMDVSSEKAPSTSLASPTTIAQRQGSEWLMQQQQNGLDETEEAEKTDSVS